MPALNKNTLTQAVDLPTWEWTRFAPAVSSALSSSCSADNGNFLPSEHGRYIYYMISATNFSRYDTWSDMYQQLQSPAVAPTTFSAMKFAGALGVEDRVISATSTTLQIAAVTQSSLVGYDVVIVSGTGAGQRRTITAAAEPVVHDSGVPTAVSNTAGAISITDTLKSFSGNQYAGYTLRVANTPAGNSGQIRRILSNTGTILTVGDTTQMNKPWHNPAIFSPAISSTAGSQTFYSIESQVVTVDSAWATTPDTTSVFRVQSGMVLCASSAASPFYTYQAYCLLTDTWYILPSYTNLFVGALTDFSIERTTENSSIWERGIATGGSVTTLVDAAHGVDVANWRTNQWAGYWVFIYSGTAAGQIRQIASNTATTLTWGTSGTAPDTTSRYLILGFDAGTATAGASTTLTDSTKAWDTNRWANYSVRILHGTGRGQTRTIASNTATVLTVQNAWDTNPSTDSVFVIMGDADKIYMVSGGNAAILIHNMDSHVATWGRQRDWGISRNAAATVGGHQPVAIASLSNVTTTATVTTAHAHQFRVGDLVTVRGATDANYNVTAVAVATVASATTFTYTMAGTPASSTLVGSQSVTTLTDFTKNWTTNEHAGRLVYLNTNAYTVGTGAATGQIVRVASNTATTLTFANSVTAPTNGVSRYSIAIGSAIGALDFGVATGTQSGTTIQDTGKSWAVNIYAGRRVRVLTSTGGPVEVIIASNTSNTLTVSAITTPTAAATQYVILEGNAKGTGTNANWVFNPSLAAYRGRYMFVSRGGGLYGFERVDLTTDRISVINTAPLSETLSTGTMAAYDGGNRIYFHKDATQRVMYLDVVTGKINGGSMYPYTAPTAIIGNRMEIFTTKDGLKYLWLNRASFAECFRCLLFW